MSAMTARRRTSRTPWVKHWQMFLPQPIDVVFDFFSNAENLEAITPPWLNFRIVTPTPIDIRQGTIIDYRLKVRGLPVKWQTLISDWHPPYRFTDQALRSPYRTWIHEHTFEPHEGGTICRDKVTYDIPGGPLRPLVHQWFVEKDVNRIFQYRAEQLHERFGDQTPTPERPVLSSAEGRSTEAPDLSSV